MLKLLLDVYQFFVILWIWFCCSKYYLVFSLLSSINYSPWPCRIHQSILQFWHLLDARQIISISPETHKFEMHSVEKYRSSIKWLWRVQRNEKYSTQNTLREVDIKIPEKLFCCNWLYVDLLRNIQIMYADQVYDIHITKVPFLILKSVLYMKRCWKIFLFIARCFIFRGIKNSRLNIQYSNIKLLNYFEIESANVICAAKSVN